jgi:YVTN family beta-propeller protein
MRILVLAAAVCLGLMGISLCRGQEFEQVIPLPDTFFNTDGAEIVAYNPANDQFYLASTGDSIVIAIDGVTYTKVAALHLAHDVSAIGCNPATNKVYIGTTWGVVAVVDGRTNQILTHITVDDMPECFGCDTLQGKVYCGTYDHITVIDAAADKALTTIDLDDAQPGLFCTVPSASRIYCGTDLGPVAIDTRTDRIVVQVRTQEPLVALGAVWSPAENRVYVGCEETLWVIDIATDSVLKRITPGGDRYFDIGLVYGAALDQVYTMDDMRGLLQVIDCGSDSVIDEIPLISEYPEQGMGAMCADPFVGRVYCASWGADSGFVFSCDVEHRSYNQVRAGASPSALTASTSARRLLAVDYCKEGDALLMDTEHDSLVATVELSDWTTAVLACPTADKLYVGCYRGDLLVLDAKSGALLTRHDGANPVTSLCIDAEGGRLYLATQGLITDCPDSVLVFDTKTDTLVAQYETEGGGETRFCHDLEQNKVYCLNEYDTLITVIDGTTSKIKDRIPMCDWPRLTCLDSVAGRLYVSHRHWESGMSVIDCGRDSVVSSVGLPGEARDLCGNPNRREVYVSTKGRDTVFIIDGTSDSITALVGVGGAPLNLCLDPVRDRMYCALGTGEVVSIDCGKRMVVARIRVGSSPSGLWYNRPSGHLFCIVGNAVAVIDPATDSVIATIPVRGRPRGFSGGRSGERVYVDCDCPFISVIRDPLPSTVTCCEYGSTFFAGRVFLRSPDPTRLMNITGRVVATLSPGENDLRHLAAGVYFAVPARGTRPTSRLVVLK